MRRECHLTRWTRAAFTRQPARAPRHAAGASSMDGHRNRQGGIRRSDPRCRARPPHSRLASSSGRRMCGEAPSFYSTAAIRRWPPENALRADRRAIPTRHRRKGEATVAALDLRHGSGPCDPTIPSRGAMPRRAVSDDTRTLVGDRGLAIRVPGRRTTPMSPVAATI